jgi:hypothetical protein
LATNQGDSTDINQNGSTDLNEETYPEESSDNVADMTLEEFNQLINPNNTA